MIKLPLSLRRLRADTSGLAMIEFAFGLPILMAMTFGGAETTNLVLAHVRVNEMAMTVADNASRIRNVADESDIHEVFAGAEEIGKTIDFEDHGRIVLSSLQENGQTGNKAGQWIKWQRCYGNLDVDPAYGIEGNGEKNATLATGMGEGTTDNPRITASAGTAVMFVEVTYDYQPLVGNIWIGGAKRMRYENAMAVRERTNFALTNTEDLDETDC